MHTTIDDEQRALAAAIDTYLDGFYEGDASKLASVFHPSCALTQSVDGVLHIIRREQWLEMIRQRRSPAALGLPRADEVLSIEVITSSMAQVKLKCAMAPCRFTDLLSMLKLDGRWQVVQKVYSTEVVA